VCSRKIKAIALVFGMEAAYESEDIACQQARTVTNRDYSPLRQNISAAPSPLDIL